MARDLQKPGFIPGFFAPGVRARGVDGLGRPQAPQGNASMRQDHAGVRRIIDSDGA